MAAKVCEDCGKVNHPELAYEERVLSWEDGVLLCNDCAILRAKRSQMRREGKL